MLIPDDILWNRRIYSRCFFNCIILGCTLWIWKLFVGVASSFLIIKIMYSISRKIRNEDVRTNDLGDNKFRMYYQLLLQKGYSWLIFPNRSEALGGAIFPIASSVGRIEAPKALSERVPSQPATRKFRHR